MIFLGFLSLVHFNHEKQFLTLKIKLRVFLIVPFERLGYWINDLIYNSRKLKSVFMRFNGRRKKVIIKIRIRLRGGEKFLFLIVLTSECFRSENQ